LPTTQEKKYPNQAGKNAFKMGKNSFYLHLVTISKSWYSKKVLGGSIFHMNDQYLRGKLYIDILIGGGGKLFLSAPKREQNRKI